MVIFETGIDSQCCLQPVSSLKTPATPSISTSTTCRKPERQGRGWGGGVGEASSQTTNNSTVPDSLSQWPPGSSDDPEFPKHTVLLTLTSSSLRDVTTASIIFRGLFTLETVSFPKEPSNCTARTKHFQQITQQCRKTFTVSILSSQPNDSVQKFMYLSLT